MIQEVQNLINCCNSELIRQGCVFLLGACVSSLINSLLARSRDILFNYAIFYYEGAKAIRAVLHDTIIEIQSGEEHTYFILQNRFEGHKLSVMDFRSVLKMTKRCTRCLDKTWAEYEKFYKHYYTKNFDVLTLPDIPDKELLKLFEIHINNLINCTVNS